MLEIPVHNQKLSELRSELNHHGIEVSDDHLKQIAKVIDDKYLWPILLDADLQPTGKDYCDVVDAYLADNPIPKGELCSPNSSFLF